MDVIRAVAFESVRQIAPGLVRVIISSWDQASHPSVYNRVSTRASANFRMLSRNEDAKDGGEVLGIPDWTIGAEAP